MAPQLRSEVDEDVPAEDHLHLRKGLIGDEIVLEKEDLTAERLAHRDAVVGGGDPIGEVGSGAGVKSGPSVSDEDAELDAPGDGLGVGAPTGQAKAAPTSAPASTKA